MSVYDDGEPNRNDAAALKTFLTTARWTSSRFEQGQSRHLSQQVCADRAERLEAPDAQGAHEAVCSFENSLISRVCDGGGQIGHPQAGLGDMLR
eukprot:4184298-Amphidinium_carterae.1